MTSARCLLGHTLTVLALAASCFAACGDDEPKPEPAKPAQTQGGENPGALEQARENVDEGVKDFQEAVKPAAEFVDEKTKEAVGEGKKAVQKVTGADEE